MTNDELAIPTAYCLLPTAYCLLPTAYCLLPIAYCLLPTAFFFAKLGISPEPAKGVSILNNYYQTME
jgi:hypothetical protein